MEELSPSDDLVHPGRKPTLGVCAQQDRGSVTQVPLACLFTPVSISVLEKALIVFLKHG